MKENLATILHELAKLLPALRKLVKIQTKRAARQAYVDEMIGDAERFDGAGSDGKYWPGKGTKQKEDEED